MNGIFDSHAHYDDEAFDADRNELLSSLPANGVCGVVNAASNLKSAQAGLSLAESYSYIWAAVGIHPLDVETAPADWETRLTRLAAHKKAVAIGEIGLDYHYSTPKQAQLALLRGQLALANRLGMPVILHDREAHGDMMELLREFRPKGVIHCFSGSVEMAREAVQLGLYIGLGGAVTFKNAVRPVEVAKAVPEDRLLLETDAPYMAPVPCRGKRCDSSLIFHTARCIAQQRGVSVTALLEQTQKNACALFSIEEAELAQPALLPLA